MEITANHINVEQLIALVEARQFPIGVDFTDPLAQRLYDACSVLMCHASVAARQASVARRYINLAMSEMGSNQGGYYNLKKCLEEMNAQEQVETPSVVLCQQYSSDLGDLLNDYQPFDVLDELHRTATLIEKCSEQICGLMPLDAMPGESVFSLDCEVKVIRTGAAMARALLSLLPLAAVSHIDVGHGGLES